MLHTSVTVDLNVVDHLVSLIQTVFLWHLLQHQLIFLKVLQRDVLFAELGKQTDFCLHLYETAVIHKDVVRFTVFNKLTEDELTLLLVWFYIALDKLNVLCLHIGFHYRSKLLLIYQF